MSFIVLFAGIGLVASFFTLTAFEKGDAAYFSCLIPVFADRKAWSEFMLVE
jgi:hypothetical protein